MSDDDSNRANARLGIYGGRGIGMPLDGIDWFEALQEPEVKPVDDLSRFVLARVIELELEPRGEVKAVYDEVGGPMAHRYAKHVRRDCIVFRQILALYVALKARKPPFWDDHGQGELVGLEQALLAVANRWSDHRDFQTEWSLA